MIPSTFAGATRSTSGEDLRRALLEQANESGAPDPLSQARVGLIEPLRNVYGVADKILAMAMSGILIGAADVRPKWLQVGVHLIAVDTLVHNFLHRTGILARLKATHPYGVGCYRPGGCAEIIARAAQQIDAVRSIRPSRPFSLGSSSSPASKASTSATATGSMTGIAAKIGIAAYTAFATEFA